METKHINELEVKLEKELEILGTLGSRRRNLEKRIVDLKREQNDPGNILAKFFVFGGFILGLLILVFGGLDWGVFSFPLLVVFGILSIVVFQLDKKKEIKKNNSKLFQIKRDLLKQNQKVESIKNELQTEKDVKLDLLIVELKKELDSDNDNTIDIIQHDNEFTKILKSNQKVVLEFEKSENRDFTKQFVKLSRFLLEKESNLQKIYLRVSDINQLEFFENVKENLLNQILFYNVLRINSLQMLSSFLDDDRITFYEIYEKFDKLGVWNTNFENQLLSKIDLLNSNIDTLILELSDMSDSIDNSISELISITDENTSSLSKKLGKIGSKLDTNNILNTINTYQNYKTNKRLR